MTAPTRAARGATSRPAVSRAGPDASRGFLRTIPVVGVPSRNDPRLAFAAILALYLILGCAFLGFNRSPTQILTTLGLACALEVALHWLLCKRELLLPLSAVITGLSLAILLNYAHDHVLLALPVFLSIASKYVFTVEGKHHYNPSLFGVATTLLFAGHLITAAPAYQWGGTIAMAA